MTAQEHIKRKIIPGTINAHPSDLALVIHYTVQEYTMAKDGSKIPNDLKESQKIIRIKSLKKNIQSLAQEILDKCNLIHPSQLSAVEQCLYFLQQRNNDSRDSIGGMDIRSSKHSSPVKDLETFDSMEGDELTEIPSMSFIEHYIEGLYEEIKDKIQSTKKILYLARIPENMRILVSNESLMSALARVLREDGKRSMELVINILYIFYSFSNYSEFHPFITSNKIGDMCIKIIEVEKSRTLIWKNDLLKSQQDQLQLQQTLQQQKKFNSMIKKQDPLLFLAFHILLNLAQDVSIEVKMVKRDLISHLIFLLERNHPSLHTLALLFLKKLSIIEENKNAMLDKSEELVRILVGLIPNDSLEVLDLIFRFLVNLSHDSTFRQLFIKSGILGKLVLLLDNGTFVDHTISLLYQLTLEEKFRSNHAFTDCIPSIMRLVLESKETCVPIHIMALAINISTIPKNSQIICQDKGLKFLFKRALKTKDPLLFKLLRSISQHDQESLKLLFLDYLDDLIPFITESTIQPEIQVEGLGILANLSLEKFDFVKLANAFDLFDYIKLQLSTKNSNSDGPIICENDDIKLEIINLIATMCIDENAIPILIHNQIPQLLLDCMMLKEEDDEIISQILFCIHRFLSNVGCRQILLEETDLIAFLVDLLYDENTEVRKMSDACLDIITDGNQELIQRIRGQKFQCHNAEWLEYISRHTEANEDIMMDESSSMYGEEREDLYQQDFENRLSIGGTQIVLNTPK